MRTTRFIFALATFLLAQSAVAQGQGKGPPVSDVNVVNAPDVNVANVPDVFVANTPLAPEKPSDLVVLTSVGSSGVCNPSANTIRVDSQILPDGTQQPFVIPEGDVLILTGISVRHRYPNALATAQAVRYLLRIDGGPVILEDSVLMGPGLEGTAVIPVGAKTLSLPMIPIAAGVALCVTGLDSSPGPVRIYGFVTKNG